MFWHCACSVVSCDARNKLFPTALLDYTPPGLIYSSGERQGSVTLLYNEAVAVSLMPCVEQYVSAEGDPSCWYASHIGTPP